MNDKNPVQGNFEPLSIEVLDGQIDINEYLKPEQLETRGTEELTYKEKVKLIEKKYSDKKLQKELEEAAAYLNSKEYQQAVESTESYLKSADYQRDIETIKRQLEAYKQRKGDKID